MYSPRRNTQLHPDKPSGYGNGIGLKDDGIAKQIRPWLCRVEDIIGPSSIVDGATFARGKA